MKLSTLSASGSINTSKYIISGSSFLWMGHLEFASHPDGDATTITHNPQCHGWMDDNSNKITAVSFRQTNDNSSNQETCKIFHW